MGAGRASRTMRQPLPAVPNCNFRRNKNTMNFKRTIALILFALLASYSAVAQSQIVPGNSTRFSNVSAGIGKFVANEYGQYQGFIYTGNASTGSSTMTIRGGYAVLSDSRGVLPYAVGVPLVINDSTPELVTPTSVSGCYKSQGMNQDGITVTCTITASFSFTHGTGATVTSGTGGLSEAAYDAFLFGGGVVVIEPGFYLNTSCTNCFASFNAAMAAVLPYGGVGFEDDRSSPPQYFSVQQTASTFLAVPTTLTAVTVGFGLNGANTTGGTYNGASTYHYCVAYVDIAGQVGACSADFSAATAGTGTANQIGFAAPAASAGAVGYVVYISLAGGTYSLSYQAPLTSAQCTLTKLETVTPACAVANATYGQSGSNAVISALTVSTASVGMQLGGVSGTLLTGNPNGRTTYGYVPSSHLAANGIPTVSLPFTVGGIGSATPIAIGTVNVPGGVMNWVGKELRICGKFTNTDVNSTVQNINIYWDAAGSNTAGSPVQIASLAATAGPGTAAAYTGNFCWQGHTSVSGAGVTAGSIFGDYSLLNYYLSATPAGIMVGGDTKTAAVASLNLAGTTGTENRISVVHTNTTGNNTPQLQTLTIEVL